MRRWIPPVLGIVAAAASLAGSCRDPARILGVGELEFVGPSGASELLSFEVRLGCGAPSVRKLEVGFGAGVFSLTELVSAAAPA